MNLTKRQTQIVELLAQGLTAEEVAGNLSRALPTVRRHVQLAYERVGARNTPHLVAISISRGFIQALCIALVMSSLLSPFDAVRSKTTQRLTRRPVVASHIA